MKRRARDLTLTVAVFAALATFGVSIARVVPFTYTSLELRVALETAQALVGFLVTHLLYGRFKRTGLRRDLVLVYGMGLFSAANLLFILGPAFGVEFRTSGFQAWAALATRIVAAVAICAAAWMRADELGREVPAIAVLCLHVASLVVIIGTVYLLQDHLPLAVETPGPRGVTTPIIEAHPVLEGAQLALMCLFWLAAAGFVRRADANNAEPLTTALAVGFVLAGFSRLNFFLYPSLYTDVVHTGDLLRLSGYVALLAGAGQEIQRYWRGLAQAAVEEERRRTARDLHDGLVQELSFIRSRVSSLTAGGIDAVLLSQISDAAERALAESRQAIQTLSGTGGQDPVTAVRRAAEDVVERAGAQVQVDIAPGLELRPEMAEPLSRIVREACTNAVRHGKARQIEICVEKGVRGSVRLAVTDDGVGFYVESLETRGFGLSSMRERAAGLGGEFRVSSVPGRGTVVEVVFPRDKRLRGHAPSSPV